MKVNVLVYEGVGVSAFCLEKTISALKGSTGKRFDIQKISLESLINDPWEQTCRCLVFPGGRDVPYERNLNPKGIEKIKRYIENGGWYFGICAGAYFACSQIEFEKERDGYEICEERSLKLIPCKAIGCLNTEFSYDLELDKGDVVSLIYEDGTLLESLYLGGCYFEGFKGRVLAHYDLRKMNNLKQHLKGIDKLPAIILSGNVLLCGVHPEAMNPDSQLWDRLIKLLDLESPATLTQSEKFTLHTKLSINNLSEKYEIVNENPSMLTDPNVDFIFAPVIDSTQTFLEQNAYQLDSQRKPVLFLAETQTKGRGRGRNNWISNLGCLQFSMLISWRLNPSKLVFIQYIVGISMISAIQDISKDIPVKLKWPNDIYVVKGPDLIKIGGILISSQNNIYSDGLFDVIIGVGINVENDLPTISLKSLCNEITCDKTLKGFLKYFALYLKEFQDNEFHNTLSSLYYSYWLHKDQLVSIKGESSTSQYIIKGINKEGFLMCKKASSTGLKLIKENVDRLNNMPGIISKQNDTRKDLVSLEPDGNSFDMLSNLIERKVK